MSVNSHVQLPKSILKRFKESTGRVFYLDVEMKKIGLCGIKKLGVQYGYYSNAAEDFFNKQIESPLAILCDKIQNFINEDLNCLKLPIETEALLKKYIMTSMARSESAKKMVFKKSVTAKFFKEQDNNDALAYISYENVFDDKNIIKDYLFGLYINCSDRQFVVPRNCYYAIKDTSITCIVAPVSPNIALGLFPPEYLVNNRDFLEYRIRVINDNDTLDYMNKQALQFEYVLNKKFVAAERKEELIQLKGFLDDHIDELQALRKQVLN